MNARLRNEYTEAKSDNVVVFPTKKNKSNLLLQKACGIILILSAAAVAALTGGDITVAFIFVPLGLYALITKENIIWRD